jgi:aminocarboxymuconate-semialdehyde decarboxylase
MKVDLHTHILPKTWPDLRERYGYGGFVRLEHIDACSARMMQDDRVFRTVEHNLWDPDVRNAECDRVHVDVQVLSTVPVMFSYWAKPEDALDLSRILNDHIADVVRRHPRRTIGLATVPLQAPELACRELHRSVVDLGLAGVEIGTHIGAWNLDDEALFPFWAECEKLDAAVFVHPWEMVGEDRMTRYWLQWLVGMPAETTLAIASVVLGGVVERFPKLRLAFAHGGGAYAATIGRIAHGFEVRPDLCQTRTKTNPKELLTRIWVDSLVHSERALHHLIEMFGASRVALGSDYPFPLGEHVPGDLIERAALSVDVKEQLLSGTALSFLGRARADYETDASRAHSLRLKEAR